jgi:hypothetical protein
MTGKFTQSDSSQQMLDGRFRFSRHTANGRTKNKFHVAVSVNSELPHYRCLALLARELNMYSAQKQGRNFV